MARFPSASVRGRRFAPAQSYANGEPGWFFNLTDASLLFQDAAGTTPVTASGDPVGKALDISGRGKHATQPNGSTQRPTFRGTYTELDGSNDSLVTPAVDLTGVSTITLMLGIRNNNGTTTSIFVESSADSSANNGAIFEAIVGANNVNSRFYRNAGVNANLRNIMTAGRDYVTRTQYTSSGTTTAQKIQVRRNGLTSVNTVVTEANPTGNFGNHVWNIGRRNNVSLPLNGRFYCLGLIGRALSDDEETAWGAYMAARMPRDVVVSCVGNSLTAGTSLPSPSTQAWPVVLQGLLGGLARCDNWGHASQTTPTLTGLLPTEGLTSCDNYRPSCVVLWEALNDMAPAIGNQTAAQAYTHYLDNLAAIRASGFVGPVIAICTGKASTVSNALTSGFTALLNANGLNDGFAAVVDYTADPSLQIPLVDGVHLDATQTALLTTNYIQPAVRAVLGL